MKWKVALQNSPQTYATRDVTSSLIPPTHTSLFPCPNTEPPCRLFLSTHILKVTLTLPYSQTFLSSCYLVPHHLSTLNPSLSLSPLYPPPFCHGGEASWCFTLLPQQHSKVKSPKIKETPCSSASAQKSDSLRAGLIIYFTYTNWVNKVWRNTCTALNGLVWLECQYSINAFAQTEAKISVSGVHKPWINTTKVMWVKVSRSSQGHLTLSESVNLWTFLSWIQPPRAALNPKMRPTSSTNQMIMFRVCKSSWRHQDL